MSEIFERLDSSLRYLQMFHWNKYLNAAYKLITDLYLHIIRVTNNMGERKRNICITQTREKILNLNIFTIIKKNENETIGSRQKLKPL